MLDVAIPVGIDRAFASAGLIVKDTTTSALDVGTLAFAGVGVDDFWWGAGTSAAGTVTLD